MLRSTGFAKTPLVTGFISVAINTILNAIMIFGLLGFPALGSDGAAIATVISIFVQCVILIVFMINRNTVARDNPIG